MDRIKVISKYLLAIFMMVAGIMHFVNPAFFLKIMPPYLPLHQELVLLSGVAELLLGVLLLFPRSSCFVASVLAWGIRLGKPPNVPKLWQVRHYLRLTWTSRPPAPGLSFGKRCLLTIAHTLNTRRHRLSICCNNPVLENSLIRC